jgi:hypothetical protein
MGKTASEKRSTGTPPSGARDAADASAPGAIPETPATSATAEPLERARLQAEVARQRVRIAKEELKRARKRVKEAKREAKRARKQAAAARKVWKKARKAHRASPTAAAHRIRQARTLKGSPRGTHRKSAHRRRAAGKAPKRRTDGNTLPTPSTET